MISIELGMVLVSLKILWMIRKQARVEHFQFWILHSIEFRLNSLAKNIREMDEKLNGDQDASGPSPTS